MTLHYKFVSSTSAVENICRGRLKFTPISELNDPLEMLPIADALKVRESLLKIRQSGLSPEQFRWLKHQEATIDLLAPELKAISAPPDIDTANEQLRSLVYDDTSNLLQFHRRVVDKIRKNVGILSLTSRYDSLPMWAHYAENAQGYVVAFNDLISAFPGDQTGSLLHLKPVKYSNEIDGMTFDPTTQDNLFFSKTTDWSYEHEWRVVASLEGCNHLDHSDLYIREIEKTHIAGVIVGWKVQEHEFQRIRELVENANPKAWVTRAQLSGIEIALTGL